MKVAVDGVDMNVEGADGNFHLRPRSLGPVCYDAEIPVFFLYIEPHQSVFSNACCSKGARISGSQL